MRLRQLVVFNLLFHFERRKLHLRVARDLDDFEPCAVDVELVAAATADLVPKLERVVALAGCEVNLDTHRGVAVRRDLLRDAPPRAVIAAHVNMSFLISFGVERLVHTCARTRDCEADEEGNRVFRAGLN